MRIITRSPAYAAALALAGAAVLAAPAAAQASAALPGLAVVPCSSSALAAAINQANSAPFATLVLARGCTYVLTTTLAPDDGLPPITGNLLILGSGGTTIRRSPSTVNFRIFDVTSFGRLTLANVTVANGKVGNGKGGGILDQGTLVLRNVRLTGNTGGLGGGLAVLSGAHARISNSELDGNDTSPTGAGGAVYNEGDLVIDQSALARNTADFFGGGVFTQVVQPTATTRISRTVITRNRAGRIGGGIFNGGATVLTGDRVVFNSAGSGGGGIFNGGTLSLLFTLVAFNSPDNCVPPGTIRGCRN
jgi:hypothetical protein